ncbi:MAG: heme exporter protein CcmB [Hyphomonadaceae bacterium]|nr:heme exporter protein CcmB [Hyphomonadaceae bacterium]
MIAVLALFRRDLAIAWGAGAGPAAPIGFFLGTVALVPLTMDAQRASLLESLRNVGIPVIWIAAALAAFMILERLFQADLEEGGLEQMLLSPAPLEALVLAKALALWIAVGLPLAAAAAPAAIMLQIPAASAPLVSIAVAVGMLAFIGAGLVGAAAAAGIKRAGVLIALVSAPFFAPPALFGAAACEAAAQGLGLGTPAFQLLCGIAVLAAALGPIAAAAALRLQAE